MAPSGGLVQPSLEGVATSYQVVSGDGAAVSLTRTLLSLGIAKAADWGRCDKSANTFVDRTFGHLFDSHGGAAISEVFGLSGSLSFSMTDVSTMKEHTSKLPVTDRPCYLSVYPVTAAFVELGPTLDRFEKIDPRLAATFYHTLMEVLYRVGRPFGYMDACEYRELMMEGIDPEDTEEYEIPDPSSCLRPAYTAKPYKAAQAKAALLRCNDREAAGWLKTALAIPVGRHKSFVGIGPEDYQDEFEGESVPFALLVNTEGDGIQACFDAQSQYWGETMGAPMFLAEFSPGDRRKVAQVVAAYTATLDILHGVSALLKVLPGADYAPRAERDDWTMRAGQRDFTEEYG